MRFRDVFLILLIGLVLAFSIWYRMLHVQDLTTAKEVNRDDANRTTTVLLKNDSWVEFQIPARATNIRLMTNAAVTELQPPGISQNDPRSGWRYTVEYELLDSNRKVIEKADYHFRSNVRQLLDADSRETINPLFFGETSMLATQSRTMQLAIDLFEESVSIIRVKVRSSDAAIKEIVARVASRIERDDYQKRHTWNRLTRERRQKICKFCVYNHSLLSDAERASLLRWHWTQAPTLGEFETRLLYYIGDLNDQEIDLQQLPSGKYAEPNWLSTVPVPEGRGQLRLNFQLVGIQSPTTAAATVEWFGIGPENRSSAEVEIGERDVCLNVEGGLVQIRATSTTVIKAYWRPDSAADETVEEVAEFEITPEPFYIRTYLADQQSVDFTVNHINAESTPMRVSLRQVFDDLFLNEHAKTQSSQFDEQRDVHWEFLDEQDKLLDTGVFPIESAISAYDYLWIGRVARLVSDASVFHFSVPAGVGKLRIRSNSGPFLVNAAVRPSTLPLVTKVPEDYYAFNHSKKTNRAWFAIKPIDHLILVRENRSFVVRAQSRPPETDLKIADGEYDWQRYSASGTWIGREMLVPHEPNLNIRREAAENTFFEIHPGFEYSYRSFETKFGRIPDQRLIFIGENKAGDMQVRLNDRVLLNRKILTSRGQFDLSHPDFANSGTLSIDCDSSVRVFISGCLVDNASMYLKRFTQKLNDGVLAFEYQKQTDLEELLTLQLFREGGTEQRGRIRVRIYPMFEYNRKMGPTASWSMLDRIYDLRPMDEASSILIGANQTTVDVGHRCFIRLNPDLPIGMYNIRIEQMDDSSAAYALLYQTIPGRHPSRRVKIGQYRVSE